MARKPVRRLKQVYRVAEKNWHNFLVFLTDLLNYFTLKIIRKFVIIIILSQKSHHILNVSLNYLVKCLKSKLKTNTTSVTTHFKKLTTGNNL